MVLYASKLTPIDEEDSKKKIPQQLHGQLPITPPADSPKSEQTKIPPTDQPKTPKTTTRKRKIAPAPVSGEGIVENGIKAESDGIVENGIKAKKPKTEKQLAAFQKARVRSVATNRR
jgi:hypothetical protein